MSRIDAQVATQAADIVRPVQMARDGQLQAQQVRTRQLQEKQDGSSLAVEDAPDPDEVRSAIARVKQVIETASGHRLDFGVDESGKNLLVKVMGEKDQVIRQIPSQEILDLRDRINQIVGLLVDKTA